MAAPDLFSPPLGNLTLDPCQSLALRRLIDAMRDDDDLYEACPEVVRRAIADFLMPPYTSAEQQIADLQKWGEDNLKLAERFGDRIRELESKLAKRAA